LTRWWVIFPPTRTVLRRIAPALRVENAKVNAAKAISKYGSSPLRL
jgi:hypothetical protein